MVKAVSSKNYNVETGNSAVGQGYLLFIESDDGEKDLGGINVTYNKESPVKLYTKGDFKTSDAIDALKGRIGHADDLLAIRQNLYTIAKALRNPPVAQKDNIDMTTDDLKRIENLLKANAENKNLDVNSRVGAAWLLGGLKEASKDMVWKKATVPVPSPTVTLPGKTTTGTFPDNFYFDNAADQKNWSLAQLESLKKATLERENSQPAPNTPGGNGTPKPVAKDGTEQLPPADPQVELIQTVMNLLDKRLDPHWVDGIYGQSTNATFGLYLKEYGDKHAVPDAIKTGHLPNKDGKLQKPADATWITQVHDFYKSKIDTDILFRMTLRENAIGILQKHSDQSGLKRPDADDQKSALMIAKLFGITDTDPKVIIAALEKSLSEDKAKWAADESNPDVKQAKAIAAAKEEGKKEATDAAAKKGDTEVKKVEKDLSAANQELLKERINNAIGRYDLAESRKETESAKRQAQIHANREHVGDAWAHTAGTVDYLKPDEKSKKLGEQYCGQFKNTVHDGADAKQGFLHIDDKGHVIYVRGELVKTADGNEKYIPHATDISKHMNDKKLVGLDTLPVSAENRAEMARVYTMNKNSFSNGFDETIGVVKKMNADINNRRDKEYFVHAHKNAEGEFVVSVVPERVRGQNAAMYVKAWEQTKPASWEKSSNLDNTEGGPSVDKQVGKHKISTADIHALRNKFNDKSFNEVLGGGPKSTAAVPPTFNSSAEAILFLNKTLGMTDHPSKTIDIILKQRLDKAFGAGANESKQTELAPALKYLKDNDKNAFEQIIGAKPLEADPAFAPLPPAAATTQTAKI